MARGISLCLGVTAMIIGSIFPFALGLKATGLNQSILLIVMLGVTGAFIHGAGFTSKAKRSACSYPQPSPGRSFYSEWAQWPLCAEHGEDDPQSNDPVFPRK